MSMLNNSIKPPEVPSNLTCYNGRCKKHQMMINPSSVFEPKCSQMYCTYFEPKCSQMYCTYKGEEEQYGFKN